MVTRYFHPGVWAGGKNTLTFHPSSDENSIGDHHKSKEGIKGRILHHGSRAIASKNHFLDSGWFQSMAANSPYIYIYIYIVYISPSLQHAQDVLQIKDILTFSYKACHKHHHPVCTPVKFRRYMRIFVLSPPLGPCH